MLAGEAYGANPGLLHHYDAPALNTGDHAWSRRVCRNASVAECQSVLTCVVSSARIAIAEKSCASVHWGRDTVEDGKCKNKGQALVNCKLSPKIYNARLNCATSRRTFWNKKRDSLRSQIEAACCTFVQNSGEKPLRMKASLGL